MANSRTLLVYVLALVVCGGGSRSFWVNANTVPVLKEPVAETGASSPQHQKHHQQYRPERFQQPLPTAQHQQIQETSRTPPSSYIPLSNNRNNAPPTYNIKNAWGLSAGSSDAGPYTSGYGYISGRTLNPAPRATVSENNYPVAERNSRQTYQGLDSLTSYLQSGLSSAVNIKSLLLGCFMTYGITNFGIPESMNTLIPIFRFFRSRVSGAMATKAQEKEAAIISNEIPNSKESGKVAAPSKEANEIVKEKVSLKKEVAEPVEDVPVITEAVDPAMKDDSNTVENEDSMKSASSEEGAVEPVQDVASMNEVAVKSRRKREVLSAQADTDLTELAAMVVSAIQSGECMQRSICLLGSQIGNSNKGRLAFTLVDKLIPDSVQGNQYFVTLKKALKGGETFCDRFRCRLN